MISRAILAVFVLVASLVSSLSTMTSKAQIKACIFDMDGTLLDTETLSTRSIQMVLDKYNTGKTIGWDLKNQILGLRGDVWGKILVESLNISEIEPSQLVSEWQENLLSLCSEVTQCSGALEMVLHCKNNSMPMAVATSSTSVQVTKKRTNHPELFSQMDHIVTGDDPLVLKGKPEPDIYLQAALRLNVNPSECLAFEDALSGVQAALAANMHCVCIPDPKVDRAPFVQLLERYGNRGVICESLADIDYIFSSYNLIGK